jgi:hypothetical protein
MSSIETTFTFGTEITFEGLTIVPLLGPSSTEPGYDTLDEALARGTVQITEVTESGHVPEINVLNQGQRPVLIIDPQERRSVVRRSGAGLRGALAREAGHHGRSHVT